MTVAVRVHGRGAWTHTLDAFVGEAARPFETPPTRRVEAASPAWWRRTFARRVCLRKGHVEEVAFPETFDAAACNARQCARCWSMFLDPRGLSVARSLHEALLVFEERARSNMPLGVVFMDGNLLLEGVRVPDEVVARAPSFASEREARKALREQAADLPRVVRVSELVLDFTPLLNARGAPRG